MENFLEIQLQMEKLTHELEFVKKLKNVETTARQHLESQLRQVRDELEQSEKERLILLQQLGQYQQRVEELEAALLKTQHLTNVEKGKDVVPIDVDDDENYVEILEMSANITEYLSGIKTDETTSDSGVSGSSADELDNTTHSKANTQELSIENNATSENCLTMDSMEETILVDSSQDDMRMDKNPLQNLGIVLSGEGQRKAAQYVVESALEFENGIGERSVLDELCVQQKVCQYCGERPEDLKLHVRLRHKNPCSGWWSCSHCDKEYKNGVSLKLHFEADHCNIRYSCSVCKTLFKTQATAKMHFRKYHGGE